ncbi:MAG: type II toxin-antitoxin system VapC family toxin [Ignavibacteriales bacterium]|nr:type II toxin-antitoxin system VapC family toxin [Ignavibacteriales bacterium]
MNELVIDTNIFIYALDKNSMFNKISSDLLTGNDNALFTTTKNISEIFAITSKLNVSRTLINRFYAEVKLNIGILFPSNQSLEIFERLIKKYKPIGNRVYDFEIVSIMLSYDIKQIATFNKKDFVEIEEIKLLAL